MSNNSKKRPYQERREICETISERAPKKYKARSGMNIKVEQRKNRAVPEEELLDPVAEARKALEMFEEVSGETLVHIIPKKHPTIKMEEGQEGGLKYSALNEERKENEEGERKKDEEEKARQKQRIEDGEARRREFRPKIASLQDSNCLI